MENSTLKVNLDTMTGEQGLEVLWHLLNKCNKAGVFTIDEAYAIKMIFDLLNKTVKN